MSIGIDILSLSKVERIWKLHGVRLEEDLLTPSERDELRRLLRLPADPTGAAQDGLCYLASRLAAKEATLKALGEPFRVAYNWRDIDVQGSTSLVVEVTGPLCELVAARRYKRMTGVWDSSKSFCIAVVMGETS